MTDGTTVGDLVELQRGQTYKSALLGEEGPVLLGLASIQRDGGFRSGSLPRYGGDTAEKLLLFPGDLYVSLKDVTQSGDLLGSVARVPASVDVGRLTQDTVKLVFREGVPTDMARFLYWILRSPEYRRYCRARGIGTTNLSLSRADFLSFRVPTPDAKRATIVATLDALDDKIELSRQMSRTLEETARAIFKSWFVDFDPVRGTATVPNEIRHHFPDRLVDSPIGSVPEGWDVTPLGEQVEVTRGLSYTGAGLAAEGMPLHNLNSILEGGGYKYDGIKHYTGDYREPDVVHPGDVIVANTDLTQHGRVIGYPALVPRLFDEESLFSHHLFRARPGGDSPVNARWVYLLLVGSARHARVAGYANGTTVNMLPKDGLTKQLIGVPPRELVARFDGIVGPLFEQQEALVSESRTLAEARDTLLPALISGKVRLTHP